MSNFNFNPVQGLRDTSVYPDDPDSEAAAREMFQGLLDQIKDRINTMPVNSDFSFSETGWKKNSIDGTIEQWGTFTIYLSGGEGSTMITMPIAFPNAFYECKTNVRLVDGADTYIHWFNSNANPLDLSHVNVRAKNLVNTSGSVLTLTYRAFGK